MSEFFHEDGSQFIPSEPTPIRERVEHLDSSPVEQEFIFGDDYEIKNISDDDDFDRRGMHYDARETSVKVAYWNLRDEVEVTIEDLENKVAIDELTGLLTRTILKEELPRFIAYAARNGESLAVLWSDLDKFKDVNDSIGHNMGDRALEDFARELQKVLRFGGDPSYRVGGDEFVSVIRLGKMKIDQASEIVDEKIDHIQALTNARFDRLGIPNSLGAGVTIGAFVVDFDDRDQWVQARTERELGDWMVEQADQNMLQKKRANGVGR